MHFAGSRETKQQQDEYDYAIHIAFSIHITLGCEAQNSSTSAKSSTVNVPINRKTAFNLDPFGWNTDCENQWWAEMSMRGDFYESSKWEKPN